MINLYNYFLSRCISDFKNSISIVCTNNKFGVINKNGEILIPIKFDKIEFFNKNILRVDTKMRFAYWSIKNQKYIWKENNFKD